MIPLSPRPSRGNIAAMPARPAARPAPRGIGRNDPNVFPGCTATWSATTRAPRRQVAAGSASIAGETRVTPRFCRRMPPPRTSAGRKKSRTV